MQRPDDLALRSEGNREELNAVPFSRHIWMKCYALLRRAISRRSSWIQHLQRIAPSHGAWDHAINFTGSNGGGALPRLGGFARHNWCSVGRSKCCARRKDNSGGCNQSFHNNPLVVGTPERLARFLTPAHYYQPDGLS